MHADPGYSYTEFIRRLEKERVSCEKSNGGIAIEKNEVLKRNSQVLPAPLCRTTEAE